MNYSDRDTGLVGIFRGTEEATEATARSPEAVHQCMKTVEGDPIFERIRDFLIHIAEENGLKALMNQFGLPSEFSTQLKRFHERKQKEKVLEKAYKRLVLEGLNCSEDEVVELKLRSRRKKQKKNANELISTSEFVKTLKSSKNIAHAHIDSATKYFMVEKAVSQGKRDEIANEFGVDVQSLELWVKMWKGQKKLNTSNLRVKKPSEVLLAALDELGHVNHRG